VSELLYRRQAGSACVQTVHSADFGKYCTLGSRSSIIVDTKFGEDVSTDIKGERGKEQAPSVTRLRTGRVDSGSLCDQSTHQDLGAIVFL